MAKRRRINKRMIILLAALGALAAAGVVAVLLRRLPRDPDRYLQAAKDATRKQQRAAFTESAGIALEAAKAQERPDLPDFYHQVAELHIRWADNDALSRLDQRQSVNTAQQLLLTALRHDPGHLPALRLLCDLYWRYSRGGRDFLAKADRLLEEDPDDHETLHHRGQARVAHGESRNERDLIESGIADLRKAAELAPEELPYWLTLASALERQERPAEAEKVYLEALKHLEGEKATRLRVRYAVFLRGADRTQEALQIIQDAIDASPDDVTGYLALAEYHMSSGAPDEAVRALEKALEVAPTDFRGYLGLSTIARRRNKPDEALEALREGLKAIDASVSSTQPTESTRRLSLARTQLNLNLSVLLLDLAERAPSQEKRRERIAEANEAFSRVGATEQDWEYQRHHGRVAYLEGEIDKAGTMLGKVVRNVGLTDHATTNALLTIYILQNRPNKAEELVDRILSRPGQQDNTTALLAKARIAGMFRQYDKAAGIVARVLRIEPGNLGARNLYAALTYVSGRRDELPEDFRVTPAVRRLMLNSAEMLWADAEAERSIDLLKVVLEHNPGDMVATRKLVQKYALMRRNDDARAVLERAARANPDNKRLATAVEMLDVKDPEKRYRRQMQMIADQEDLSDYQRAWERSLVALGAGKHDEFEKYLRQAVEIDPTKPAAVDRLFRYALGQQNWETAADCVAKAAATNLDDVGGDLYRAELAYSRKNWTEARSLLHRVLQKRPYLKRARLLLGSTYMYLADEDPANLAKAQENFEAILKANRTDVGAMVGMAKLAHRRKDWEAHEQWVRDAYELDRRNPYIERWYLQYSEEAADPSELIGKRARLFMENPRDWRNADKLATLYEKTGQIKKAESVRRHIFENCPDVQFRTEQMARHYLRRKQHADIDRLFSGLLSKAEDKVGVLVSYAGYLSAYAPGQAMSTVDRALELDEKDPRALAAKARMLAERGAYRRAAAVQRRLVAVDPSVPGYRKTRVRYLMSADALDQAAAELESLYRDHSDDGEVLMLKGLLAMRRSELGKAGELLDQAVTLAPRNPDPLRYRAQLHMMLGKPTEAKRDIQSARRLVNRPELTLELAMVHRELNEFEQAEVLYRQLMERPEQYVRAAMALGEMYLRNDRWSQMESLLSRAQKRRPDHPGLRLLEARMWRKRAERGRRLAALAKAYELAPRNPAVVESYMVGLLNAERYDQVLSASEQWTGSTTLSRWVRGAKAAALVGKGREAEAEKLFIEVLGETTPRAMKSMMQQVIRAYGMNRAITKLTAWAERFPGNWLFRALLGELYIAEGGPQDYAKALPLLEEALTRAKSPDDKAAVQLMIAAAYYGMSEWSKAERAYLAVLKHRPDDPRALNNLAYLYAEQLGQPKKGLEYVRRAARLLPREPQVLDTYGWTLAKLERFDRAEHHLLRAAQLGEPTAAIRYHLGWVYENTGRLSEALGQYKQAMDLVTNRKEDRLYPLLRDAIKRVEEIASARSET